MGTGKDGLMGLFIGITRFGKTVWLKYGSVTLFHPPTLGCIRVKDILLISIVEITARI